jgi:hypothetical protein
MELNIFNKIHPSVALIIIYSYNIQAITPQHYFISLILLLQKQAF